MKKTIGFFVFPGVHALDVTAPWEVFSSWSKYQDIECLMFGETATPMRCSSGIIITPTHHIDHLPKLDIVLVPGGGGVTEICKNQQVLEKLKILCLKAEEILSVCAGTYILNAAGVLQGRKTATYWRAASELALAGVNICQKRIVMDGALWSSGGVTSGLDMALAYVAAKSGRDIAGKVQLMMEYFPPSTNYARKELTAQLPNYPCRLAGAEGEEMKNYDEGTRKLPQYLMESYFSNDQIKQEHQGEPTMCLAIKRERQENEGEPYMKRERKYNKDKKDIPEAEFMAQNSSPVSFHVKVPFIKDSPWRLDGQTLLLSLNLQDTVASIKTRIHEEVGMSIGKQNLFHKHNNYNNTKTLAYYNITPGTLINLRIKKREKRPKKEKGLKRIGDKKGLKNGLVTENVLTK